MVSPDGQLLAWVIDDGVADDLKGTLTVSRLDGTSARTVDNVICSILPSSWSADSRKLKVSQVVGGAATRVHVDVAIGAINPTPTEDEAVWSADRAFRVRKATDAKNSFVVEAAAGDVVRTVKGYSNDFGGFYACGYALKGVSNDGRYVAIGLCTTDQGRGGLLGGRYLYDTQTGEHVTLPVAHPGAVMFLEGGTILVYGRERESSPGSFHLMSTAGDVITSVTEPAELPDRATFLRYVGSQPS